ncbi:hypothetical protein [Streptomyces sp. NPDC055709]
MRRIAAIAHVLAATSLMTAVSLTPASADSVADIDNYIRNSWQDGYGGLYAAPVSAKSVLGSTLSDYCNRVGIVGRGQGGANGECVLLSFAETARPSFETDYRRRVSSEPYTNCNDREAVPTDLAYTKMKTVTNTVGASISVGVSVNYSVKPFGVGVSGSVTTTVGANYSYSWGESTSVSNTYHIQTPPGYRGSLDFATFHGTAHGIATVEIFNNGYPNNPTMPPTGTYKVITDIKGDLPPADEGSEAWRAQPTYDEFVPDYDRLTNAELKQKCGSWPKDSRGNLLQWVSTGPGYFNGYYVLRPDGDQPPTPDFVL